MKHGWNWWDDYLSIHERVLRFYSQNMLQPKTYKITVVTESFYLLVCTGIQLKTYKGTIVRVDIYKEVFIDNKKGRLKAKTYKYSYNANLPHPNAGNLIRYDSPHEDHNQFHHKHDSTVSPPKLIRLEDDNYPHVGDFLKEVLETF